MSKAGPDSPPSSWCSTTTGHLPRLPRLLDVDHVDLIVSGYSTNIAAPAIAMGRDKLFVSLFCLAVNTEFHPRYFSMLPTGPDPNSTPSRVGFFISAVAQSPQQAEPVRDRGCRCGIRAQCLGRRATMRRRSGSDVYDGRYPPTTTDLRACGCGTQCHLRGVVSSGHCR